jgi:hypothetical protein
MEQWRGRPVADRSEAAYLYHVTGLTLQEVGDRIGVTRERVRQILRDVGRPSTMGGPPAQRARRAEERRLLDGMIVEHLAEKRDEIMRLRREGESPRAVALRFGVPQRAMRKFLRERLTADERDEIRRGNVSAAQLRAEEEEMVESLRRAAPEVVGPRWREVPMARLDFEAWFRAGNCAVGPQTIEKRLGSWVAAQEAAGLPVSRHPRRPRKDRIGEGEVLTAIRALWTELGRRPTYHDYEEWARGTGRPSAATARNRFGTWWAAVDAAGGPLLLG